MNRLFRSIPAAIILTVVLALTLPLSVLAGNPIIKISQDLFTNSSSQHATQVEPSSFANGSTLVSAVQTGRFYDGGSSDICYSTSTDSGASWTNGCLPGITKHQNPANPYDRVSDPSVAYDAKHNVWLISSLPLIEPSVDAAGVITSRSTDGGLTWGNPVVVSDSGVDGGADKNWIVCDNTPTSPYYGNCYTEWDDYYSNGLVFMSTSSDGGLTWSPRKSTADNVTGIGGQPLVQPNGTVIVPIDDYDMTSLRSFTSTNGGASWKKSKLVTKFKTHWEAGNLRNGPLPSAAIDASGKVYVVWADCRFRKGCKSNDLVMTTTTDGNRWSDVDRIPLDTTKSTVDHFIPGLAVDPATSGKTAKLAVTYYFYTNTNCTEATCQLMVGFASSSNGGKNWSAPTMLGGPMSIDWLPATSEGYMVGDYIATSFSNGRAFPFYTLALAPSGGVFDQALYTLPGGLAPVAGSNVNTDLPLTNATSDGAKKGNPKVR